MPLSASAFERANVTGAASCPAVVLIFDVNIRSSRIARITR
jgi:hypothetical protein